MPATEDRPVSRRPTGVAIGVSVLAIVVVVASILLLSKDEDEGGGSLRDQLVDIEWTVLTVDGVEVMAERPPTFILRSDGRIVGFDGCNQYGFDLSMPGGWTLTDDTLGLDQQLVSTEMACPDVPIQVIPVADGTQLALDGQGILTLTSSSGRQFTASA